MEQTGLILSALAVLVLLILLRVPVGLAMILVGGFGYATLNSWPALSSFLKTGLYHQFSSYSLSVVPLFVLMGQLATVSGLSRDLFDGAHRLLHRRRGGVAMAAVAACGAFGAICGSSLATAATMGRTAMPELRRLNYPPDAAAGALAAGGTLGILIPPSIVLVIYALITEQNIAKLFIAALVPGALALLGYLFVTALRHRKQALEALPVEDGDRSLWLTLGPAAAIFLSVIGGIYAGWFTPTEAAAIGTIETAILALLRGRLTWANLRLCLLGTAATTAMIFLILFGAELFSAFLALARAPALLQAFVVEAELSPTMVLAAVLLMYILLGCVMESLSMILLTMPIIFPTLMGLDFGLPPEEAALWIGVLTVIAVEMGLITPPVGMNVFIIHKVAEDVPLPQIFRGVLPYLAWDVLRLGLLLFFPALTLTLVRWLY